MERVESNPSIVTSASAPPSSSSSSSSSSIASSPSTSRSFELCTPSTLVSPTKLCTRNESSPSLPDRRSPHIPLMPGMSTAARSDMPTPFLTIRTEPSAATPEQVATTDWPARPLPPPWEEEEGTSPTGRRSKSTIGPKLSCSSTRDRYVVSSSPVPVPRGSSRPPETVPTGDGASSTLRSWD